MYLFRCTITLPHQLLMFFIYAGKGAGIVDLPGFFSEACSKVPVWIPAFFLHEMRVDAATLSSINMNDIAFD
ncbi:MAG: hypothetical protein JWQ40_5018 [Segetibacter sp.]|nr:hypothetical protein [Segetibacter sp.]